MSLAHQSIATINSPEFINLQPMDINPLMSSCQIKVLYIGENRNQSYISKEVASEMAKTLRGAPIVGYYKENKEDFADHGEQVILDDEGIHFKCLTKPYGFVAPDAKVWFQDFEDYDDFGNSKIRTYLMTNGYLWSGQFEEVKQVLNEGRPQSMELDEKSLQGNWSTNIKENMEFFIINDAIFSKLCILGDDVEPCFEGSAITAPQVSTSFTIDKDFKHTLFQMMEELKYTLKGGNKVADIKDKASEVQEKEDVISKEVTTDFTENQDNAIESSSNENDSNIESGIESTFEKKEEEEKDSDDTKEEESDDKTSESDDKDEDEDEEKKKYTALEEKYNALQSDFTALETEVIELRKFKNNAENKQKEDLINQFYMLSDEDKKDVIENKDKYSFEEIESKLAVICFKKKVNFNLEDTLENKNNMKEKEDPVTTFNVDNTEDSTPDWIKAVESTMNNRF